MNITFEILSAIGGAVFGAGGLVMLLRLLKRDVDGLGGRVRIIDDNIKILLMAIVSEDRKEWLAEQLLRK